MRSRNPYPLKGCPVGRWALVGGLGILALAAVVLMPWFTPSSAAQ